jgi:hypothetical protein
VRGSLDSEAEAAVGGTAAEVGDEAFDLAGEQGRDGDAGGTSVVGFGVLEGFEEVSLPFEEEAFEGVAGESDAAGAVGVGLEVLGPEDAEVGEAEDEAIDDGVAEFFEEVEGEAGASGVDGVVGAQGGVEAAGFEASGELVAQQDVGEREEGIDGVG